MARKLRLEFPGAIYHVINRGHRRTGPFDAPATRSAFERCLFEACLRAEWRLHAYAILSNHFHLALETPHGNLVSGMQWLQATFTNRYNRFRDETGYGAIFQGRYKALLIEPGTALGMLSHYIHLNPVRAGLVALADLRRWRWSSYRWLRERDRPPWMTFDTALHEAGQLSDEPDGWNAYADYLAWQAAEGPAGKNAAYVSMSRGWVLGSAAFQAELVRDFDLEASSRAWEVHGAAEVARLRAEAKIAACLQALGRSEKDVALHAKGKPWKIAVAAWMKLHSTVSNPWLAQRLGLGSGSQVSHAAQTVRNEPESAAASLFRRLNAKFST